MTSSQCIHDGCYRYQVRFSKLRPQCTQDKTLTSGWFGIGSDDRLGLWLTIYIFIIHYTTCWLWPVDGEASSFHHHYSQLINLR
ncbi:hypothetical protein H9L39_00259 [Fusarium oxysporum f. sp. albedinis]|nr:hypothetical protein H9L39_00259 [Fusarium oxysporum f. sp. albedinis]